MMFFIFVAGAIVAFLAIGILWSGRIHKSISKMNEQIKVLEESTSDIARGKLLAWEDYVKKTRADRAAIISSAIDMWTSLRRETSTNNEDATFRKCLFPESYIQAKYQMEESLSVSYVYFLDTTDEATKIYLKMKWGF